MLPFTSNAYCGLDVPIPTFAFAGAIYSILSPTDCQLVLCAMQNEMLISMAIDKRSFFIFSELWIIVVIDKYAKFHSTG